MLKNNFTNESSVVFLNNYEEAIGKLRDIEKHHDQVVLSISLERKIILPSKSIVKPGLSECIGKNISVFNCDGTYYWQQIQTRGC